MKEISLVLSGGGARGIAHIGVIEELETQGFNIHSISGTSMGSLVGGIYAIGKLKQFKEMILDIHKIDVIKLIDFTFIRSGLVKGDKAFNVLKEFIPEVNIQDLGISYSAIATDLVSRKEVVFDKGSLLNAIRASVAIPSVFTPVKNDKAVLVDGGVINNIPINHAKRVNGDLLIAVNVNSNIPMPKKNKHEEGKKKYTYYKKIVNNRLHKIYPHNKKKGLSRFDILNESYEIMRDELVNLSLKVNPPDILIEIPRDSSKIYDFYKAEELIEMGRQATIKSMDKFMTQPELNP